MTLCIFAVVSLVVAIVGHPNIHNQRRKSDSLNLAARFFTIKNYGDLFKVEPNSFISVVDYRRLNNMLSSGSYLTYIIDIWTY